MFLILKEVDKIINSNNSKENKIRLICELVRDIPYKVTGSSDPKDIIKNNAGSCTPKHIFLAQCLQKLDVPLKFLAVSYYYEKIPVKYPEKMMDLVRKMPLTHHTALKIKVDNKWIIIDVTWDSKLKDFQVNKEFDLKSDNILCVIPEEIIEKGSDPNKFKKEDLKPSEEERKIQKEFYKHFNDFIAESRNS